MTRTTHPSRFARITSRGIRLGLAPLVLATMALGVAAAGGPIAYPGMPVVDSGCLADYDKYIDRSIDGEPVDLEGRVDVPVLVVHGWTGAATQFAADVALNAWDVDTTVAPEATGSMLRRLSDIPRASVFTFDYHEFSARWVESNEQGSAMAGVIDCLYQASGHPVNIVAHSMGGLIIRQALKDTPEREAKIGQVVTIATPNTGSDSAAGVANIGKAMLASNPSAYPFIVALASATKDCGIEKVNDEGLSSACPDMEVVEGFFAEGGVALRTGSAEIARLPAWPDSVNVHAIAGDYVLNTGIRLGLFEHDIMSLSLGDLIVSTASALDGADTTHVVKCDVSLEGGIGIVNSTIATANNVTALDGVSLLACYHTGILTNLLAVNNVIGTIQTAVERDVVNNLIDLSGYQITQQTLEPLSPNADLLTVETMKTDRQSMVGSASTTIDDPQNGPGSAYSCVPGEWCPALSDEITGGNTSLYIDYRQLDAVSDFDQVQGFLVQYPVSEANAYYLPKTDRGIGAGATKEAVRAAYADSYTWDWEPFEGQYPANADLRVHATGVSVMPDECGLHPLFFLFDENHVLTAIGTGTLWDNCTEDYL
jgi:pimeloyl-ACP methyl ester carboxylesterase